MCGLPIPRERLKVLPGTKRCANCQQEQESGQTAGDADYCPRCGAIRELRPSRAGGVTRYAMFCPACHR
jgi:RNA polymerase-binding transcription factor DksA